MFQFCFYLQWTTVSKTISWGKSSIMNKTIEKTKTNSTITMSNLESNQRNLDNSNWLVCVYSFDRIPTGEPFRSSVFIRFSPYIIKMSYILCALYAICKRFTASKTLWTERGNWESNRFGHNWAFSVSRNIVVCFYGARIMCIDITY